MNSQSNWITPIELIVTPQDSPVADVKKVKSGRGPIELPGHLEEGDNVLSFAECLQDEGGGKQGQTGSSSQDASESGLVTVAADREEIVLSSGRIRPFLWFLALTLLFLTAVVVQDTILFVESQFSRHLILGWGFALVAGGAGVALLWVTLEEWTRLRSLRRVQSKRDQAIQMRQADCHGQAIPYATEIMKGYGERPELQAGWKQFQDGSHASLTDREILTLFSSQVLVGLDKKAYDLVVMGASTSALMTALSPMAWLDATLFLWRNVRMMRQIAVCYGFRPGFFGSVSLLKEVMAGMVASATADLLTGEAVESVGGSVTSMLFAKAGQGLANGLLSARIGIQTMRLCRPVPFLPEENPSLKRVRNEMMAHVKERMS